MLNTRLKSLRESKQLTQQELADKLNLSRVRYNNYETGKRSPDYDTLQVIANFYDVSTDYLLGNTDNPNSEVALTDKDEKDIAKTMQKLKEQLSNDQGLMFDGDVLDEETAKLLLAAIEQQERMIKKINKKYTPKKYRK